MTLQTIAFQKVALCFRNAFVIVFLLLYNHVETYAQKSGDTWIIGYTGFGNPDYSVMHLNFSSGDLKLEWHFDENLHFAETSSSICNEEGEVILSTNGMQIFGQYGVLVEASIAYDGPFGYWDYFLGSSNIPYGFPEMDGAIILPIPETPNEYEVIYHYGEQAEGLFKVSRLLSARIRFNSFDDFNVIYKDKPIGPEVEWYRGQVNAVRHANGRDWWVMAFQSDSKNYFAHLLDPDGIRLHHTGEVDTIIPAGLGDAAFSRLGNYYARMDAVTFDLGQFISVFSFDRCTGDFTRLATIVLPAAFFTGVSFSPSEKYLYGDDDRHLWQWNLDAIDIPGSQVLIDSFDGFIQPGWFGMYFAHMTEAPDGRIYNVPPAGSSEFIHVIGRPNLPGKESQFRQHHIDLKRPNGRTAPNVANFRLGPSDGSPCDTLGLDNHPVAWWRYEEDQPGLWKSIRFTDLSYFDPQTWYWDFGDGQNSSEQHPFHDFDPGIYHVCLTVSNAFASDSSCQWIEILTTSIEEETAIAPFILTPNPFKEYIEIKTKDEFYKNITIALFDIHGRKVFSAPSITIPSRVFLPDMPAGVYYVVIKEPGNNSYSFSVLKAEMR